MVKQLGPRVYTFGEFELDPARRLLSRAGQPVALNAKAFDLLVVLVENAGRVLSKDELMNLIWRDQFVEEANLAVQISTLRKALGEQKDKNRFIVTVPGHGYRFVAELTSPEGFIVEQRTVSQIVIEQETDDGSALAKIPEFVTPGERTKRSRLPYVIAASVFLACVLAAFGVFKFLNQTKTVAPFQKIKLSRLTNDGKVAGVTISPDGKFIAYALSQNEGSSLWVQQVDTASNIPILPPTKAEVWGLTFSPESSYLYYSLFSADRADPRLFRIPSLGGVAQKIPNVIAHAISFSPDGKRFAYTQPDTAAGFNYLMVADADGGNSQALAKKKHPNTFEFQWHVAAWSPDGGIIACIANHFDADESYSSIIAIDAKDGTEKPLSAERWYDVLSMEWLKDGRGLVISAHKKSSKTNQVWFVPYPEGAGRQITNDLAQYDWLGVSAKNGPSLVAQQTNTVNSIFIGEPKTDPNDLKEVVSEVGPLSPLMWTPEDKVVFRSNKDGGSNLWIMEADGSKRRQLTVDAQVDSRGLCMSPDGKQLIFTSWRSGQLNLWRFDADGGSVTQLTDGGTDAYPRCSPDGQWVVFQRGIRSKPALWKVALAGGAPTPLTEFSAKWPAISNDGSRIAYFHMNKGKWNIGIISSAGGPMLQRLDVPAAQSGHMTYWSKDDRSLFYVSSAGEVGNVWELPLDGTGPKAVTDFKSRSLDDFAWSPDGRRLAGARGTRLSDVVLIEDVR